MASLLMATDGSFVSCNVSINTLEELLSDTDNSNIFMIFLFIVYNFGSLRIYDIFDNHFEWNILDFFISILSPAREHFNCLNLKEK